MFGLELIPRWDFRRAIGEGPIRSLPDEIDGFERSDPTRTRLLAWTVACWCASLSLFRPVEGAVFGVASFILLYRLPATLRVMLALVRTPVVVLVLAQLALTALATALGPEPYDLIDLVPKRLFLATALVVPVLPRWRLLLAGLVAGGLAQVVYSIAAAALGGFTSADIPFEPAEGASAALAVSVAFGVALTMVGPIRMRLAGAVLAFAAFAVQAQGSMRSAVVASAAAVASYIALRPGKGRLVGGAVFGGIAAIGVAASLWAGGAAAEGVRDRPLRLDYESINHYSSNRLELWRLTLEAVQDRPWFGHGRNSWRSDIDAARPAEADAVPQGAELIWTERRVGYGHNTPLDIVYESGVVGGLLIGIAALIVLRAGWRVHRSEGAIGTLLLAILVGFLVLSQFDFVVRRAILGSLILVASCLVFAPSISARCESGPSARARDRRLVPAIGWLEDQRS